MHTNITGNPAASDLLTYFKASKVLRNFLTKYLILQTYAPAPCEKRMSMSSRNYVHSKTMDNIKININHHPRPAADDRR